MPLSTSKLLLPLLLLFSCKSNNTEAQARILQQQAATSKMHSQNAWVDSVYSSLSQEQRIGQLFMVAAYSAGKNYNEPAIKSLVSRQLVGGLIYMQGNPAAQAQQTNTMQSLARVPLLIGMDAEWGLGMRLSTVDNLARQMMLGAAADSMLVYDLGALVAEQCKLLGVHINFAPDIDVNNNPNNPVINFRSFGDNKLLVSKLGIAYAMGLQNNGVMACAKHFPGHGDVTADSHLDLPVINKSKSAMEQLELYPFKELIGAGVGSIMIAHLSVPSLDATKNTPTTLSKKVVTGLLREEMGYKGLVFTDAMNMKGVTKYYSSGLADLKAFEAGNDVLLFSQDVPTAIAKINNAVASGQITQERLAASVKRILAAKYTYVLGHTHASESTELTTMLNAKVKAYNSRAARAALTMVKNENSLLTKSRPKTLKVAYLPINGGAASTLKQGLEQQYGNVAIITSASQASKYDLVIVGVHNISMYPGSSKSYGIGSKGAAAISAAAKLPNALTIIFGNAYAAKYACMAKNLMVAYDDNNATQQAVVEALSGRLVPKGKMPVQACK